MQFDICIANILQGPLLDLQPRLSGYVKPGGMLLLSGILTSQVLLPTRFDCVFVSFCNTALPVETSVSVTLLTVTNSTVTKINCWVSLS